MSANTYEQIRESITTNVVATIASSIKNQHAPFMHDVKAGGFDRAFNPTNGNSWEGLNSLMLDTKKAEKGYPTNEWITMRDASYLGAPSAEIDALKNAWQDKVVKVQYIAKKEYVNVHKKDENGNLTPLKDAQGNERMGKDGKPLYEFEMEVQKDSKGQPVINPKTNEPYMNIKKELRDLPTPMLKTDLVYNIAEFPTLAKELEKVKEVRAELAAGKNINTQEVKNFNKFKPLNEKIKYNHILSNSKDYQADCKKVVLQDIKARLSPVTAEQITHYFNAQNFNRDYSVPRGFNEQQKKDIENILTKQNEKGAESNTKEQEKAQEKPKEKEVAKEREAVAKKPKAKAAQGRGR